MKKVLFGLVLLAGVARAGTLEFPGSVWMRGDNSTGTQPEYRGWHQLEANVEQGVRLKAWPHITPYAAYVADRQAHQMPGDSVRYGIKNTSLIPGVQFGFEHQNFKVLPFNALPTRDVVFIILYKEWK